jgi:hypothetical protein
MVARDGGSRHLKAEHPVGYTDNIEPAPNRRFVDAGVEQDRDPIAEFVQIQSHDIGKRPDQFLRTGAPVVELKVRISRAPHIDRAGRPIANGRGAQDSPVLRDQAPHAESVARFAEAVPASFADPNRTRGAIGA